MTTTVYIVYPVVTHSYRDAFTQESATDFETFTSIGNVAKILAFDTLSDAEDYAAFIITHPNLLGDGVNAIIQTQEL